MDPNLNTCCDLSTWSTFPLKLSLRAYHLMIDIYNVSYIMALGLFSRDLGFSWSRLLVYE